MLHYVNGAKLIYACLIYITEVTTKCLQVDEFKDQGAQALITLGLEHDKQTWTKEYEKILLTYITLQFSNVLKFSMVKTTSDEYGCGNFALTVDLFLM